MPLVAAAFSSLLGVKSTSASAPSVTIHVLNLYLCIVSTKPTKEIYVGIPGNQKLLIETNLSDTIESVEIKIEHQMGIPMEQFELTTCHKHLDNGNAKRLWQM